MRQEVNYHTLRAIVDDIDRQSNLSPAFSLFNREKIRRFYQQNGLRIKTMNDRYQKLVEAHVVHEDGKPKTEPGENGRDQYVFASPEAKDLFLTEYNAFMELSFTIEL